MFFFIGTLIKVSNVPAHFLLVYKFLDKNIWKLIEYVLRNAAKTAEQKYQRIAIKNPAGSPNLSPKAAVVPTLNSWTLLQQRNDSLCRELLA